MVAAGNKSTLRRKISSLQISSPATSGFLSTVTRAQVSNSTPTTMTTNTGTQLSNRPRIFPPYISVTRIPQTGRSPEFGTNPQLTIPSERFKTDRNHKIPVLPRNVQNIAVPPFTIPSDNAKSGTHHQISIQPRTIRCGVVAQGAIQPKLTKTGTTTQIKVQPRMCVVDGMKHITIPPPRILNHVSSHSDIHTVTDKQACVSPPKIIRTGSGMTIHVPVPKIIQDCSPVRPPCKVLEKEDRPRASADNCELLMGVEDGPRPIFGQVIDIRPLESDSDAVQSNYDCKPDVLNQNDIIVDRSWSAFTVDSLTSKEHEIYISKDSNTNAAVPSIRRNNAAVDIDPVSAKPTEPVKCDLVEAPPILHSDSNITNNICEPSNEYHVHASRGAKGTKGDCMPVYSMQSNINKNTTNEIYNSKPIQHTDPIQRQSLTPVSTTYCQRNLFDYGNTLKHVMTNSQKNDVMHVQSISTLPNLKESQKRSDSCASNMIKCSHAGHASVVQTQECEIAMTITKVRSSHLERSVGHVVPNSAAPCFAFYSCRNCDKTFQDQQALKSHILHCHNYSKPTSDAKSKGSDKNYNTQSASSSNMGNGRRSYLKCSTKPGTRSRQRHKEIFDKKKIDLPADSTTLLQSYLNAHFMEHSTLKFYSQSDLSHMQSVKVRLYRLPQSTMESEQLHTDGPPDVDRLDPHTDDDQEPQLSNPDVQPHSDEPPIYVDHTDQPILSHKNDAEISVEKDIKRSRHIIVYGNLMHCKRVLKNPIVKQSDLSHMQSVKVRLYRLPHSTMESEQLHTDGPPDVDRLDPHTDEDQEPQLSNPDMQPHTDDPPICNVDHTDQHILRHKNYEEIYVEKDIKRSSQSIVDGNLQSTMESEQLDTDGPPDVDRLDPHTDEDEDQAPQLSNSDMQPHTDDHTDQHILSHKKYAEIAVEKDIKRSRHSIVYGNLMQCKRVLKNPKVKQSDLLHMQSMKVRLYRLPHSTMESEQLHTDGPPDVDRLDPHSDEDEDYEPQSSNSDMQPHTGDHTDQPILSHKKYEEISVEKNIKRSLHSIVDGNLMQSKRVLRNQKVKPRYKNVIQIEAVDKLENGTQQKYLCSVCDTVFDNWASLKHHVVVCGCGGGRLKQYGCFTCGKAFVSVWKLKNHMLIHGPKLHSCPTCHKRFASHGNCKQHIMMIHSHKKNTPLRNM